MEFSLPQMAAIMNQPIDKILMQLGNVCVVACYDGTKRKIRFEGNTLIWISPVPEGGIDRYEDTSLKGGIISPRYRSREY